MKWCVVVKPGGVGAGAGAGGAGAGISPPASPHLLTPSLTLYLTVCMQCLMPGEAVVRVEDAPGNARRIFTGVDIIASVEDGGGWSSTL